MPRTSFDGKAKSDHPHGMGVNTRADRLGGTFRHPLRAQLVALVRGVSCHLLSERIPLAQRLWGWYDGKFSSLPPFFAQAFGSHLACLLMLKTAVRRLWTDG